MRAVTWAITGVTFGGAALVSAFDPAAIEPLTKAARYTFERICELPNPDPFFDERVPCYSLPVPRPANH